MNAIRTLSPAIPGMLAFVMGFLVSCGDASAPNILSGVNNDFIYQLECYRSVVESDVGVSEGNFYFNSIDDPLNRVVRITIPFKHPELVAFSYGEVVDDHRHTLVPSVWSQIDTDDAKKKMNAFLDSVIAKWQKRKNRRDQVVALKSVLNSGTAAVLKYPLDKDEWEDDLLDRLDSATEVNTVVDTSSKTDGTFIVDFGGPRINNNVSFFSNAATPLALCINSINGRIDLIGDEHFYGHKLMMLLRDFLGSSRSSRLDSDFRQRLERIAEGFSKT